MPLAIQNFSFSLLKTQPPFVSLMLSLLIRFYMETSGYLTNYILYCDLENFDDNLNET